MPEPAFSGCYTSSAFFTAKRTETDTRTSACLLKKRQSGQSLLYISCLPNWRRATFNGIKSPCNKCAGSLESAGCFPEAAALLIGRRMDWDFGVCSGVQWAWINRVDQFFPVSDRQICCARLEISFPFPQARLMQSAGFSRNETVFQRTIIFFR